MCLGFVQLHPNGLADTVHEPALGARSHDAFPDTEIHDVVWALRLDQVNLCRNITWPLAMLDQHGLGSHTERKPVWPRRTNASLRLGAKKEGSLHPIETNLGH